MNKLILGATLTVGLLLGATGASRAAPGDGLDRSAAATGNSNMGAMHRNAGGGMAGRRMGRRPMRRHHRRH